jgi:acyl-CoA thioesterase I
MSIPPPPARRHSRVKLMGWYLAMLPLELYGRVSGVYRPRCKPLTHPIANTPLRNAGPIVCFGDSLTAGYGVTVAQSYPAQLAGLLNLDSSVVINLGKSGETAADGLKRLDKDVLSLDPPPCIVVIGFGGNDLMQRRAAADVFNDLAQIIDKLHHAGCAVILMGLRGSWLYKIDYETPFHELVVRKQCGLVPLCLDGIWGWPWRMADAAHPNGRGYKRLAMRVAAVLKPILC